MHQNHKLFTLVCMQSHSDIITYWTHSQRIGWQLHRDGVMYFNFQFKLFRFNKKNYIKVNENSTIDRSRHFKLISTFQLRNWNIWDAFSEGTESSRRRFRRTQPPSKLVYFQNICYLWTEIQNDQTHFIRA